MKVCIIHGSPRKGNTYRAADILKNELRNYGEMEFKEFFLPKDMPHFCCGCYNCIEKSEEKCPHAQYVQPIVDAMKEADGLIFTSPVYVLAESAGMKAFLDHMAYAFMPHRPIEEMFSKVAMIISTTAGAGTKHPINTISRSLRFWGVKRIEKCGFTLMAKEWNDMKEQKKNKFSKVLAKKAKKFYKLMLIRDKLSTRFFTKIIFKLMRGALSKYKEGNPDKVYWQKKGWLEKKRPF